LLSHQQEQEPEEEREQEPEEEQVIEAHEIAEQARQQGLLSRITSAMGDAAKEEVGAVDSKIRSAFQNNAPQILGTLVGAGAGALVGAATRNPTAGVTTTEAFFLQVLHG
jgi:hypothetical protein